MIAYGKEIESFKIVINFKNYITIIRTLKSKTKRRVECTNRFYLMMHQEQSY